MKCCGVISHLDCYCLYQLLLYVQYKVKQFKNSTYFYHAIKCNFLAVAVMMAELGVVVIIVFAAVVGLRNAATPLIFL